MFSHEAKFENHDFQIRQALFKKAGKYGQLDLPFVITVNMLEYIDHIDIMNALFGDEVFIIETEKLSRKQNGLWMGQSGPRNTSISGVLFFTLLGINTISKSTPRLYKNPWAKNPHNSILDIFPKIQIENGKIKQQEGKSIAEIFQLPFEWPKVEQNG